MRDKYIVVFCLLCVSSSTHRCTFERLFWDLESTLFHITAPCCQLLTVPFCVLHALERMAPDVLTFKHPPLTWSRAMMLFIEIVLYVEPQRIKAVLKTREKKDQVVNLLFLDREIAPRSPLGPTGHMPTLPCSF